MPEVELSAGMVEYEDSGGEGPALVLIHGLAMDSRVWEDLVAELAPELRCVAPTLPFGSHRVAMKPDADLSLVGLSRLVSELIAKLGLKQVTLCFNDWSCGQVMVAEGLLGDVDRLIFASCETEGNYPPGLAGQAAVISARVPGGLSLMRRILLSPRLRRLPMIYGQMTRRGVPDDLMRSWLEPLARPEIQRDVRKYVLDVKRGRKAMSAATASLASYDDPVLVLWDRDGKMMPNDLGRKLAGDFPNARFVEVADSYTLIPIDQPAAMAAAIREFVTS
jgi:pimeloyl-ACP methyl ester carboxylesterase